MRPEISVATAVSAKHVGRSLNQSLDDAIQIGIKKSASIRSFADVHFLQFITRQCPDFFEHNHGSGAIQWESEESHYMTNLFEPRWRVDSASHPSPFYETGGAHEDTRDWLYIYDQPGFSRSSILEERIIGCTFLIAKDQVFKQILWSRQIEVIKGKLQSTYCYKVYDVSQLPEWTLHALRDHYLANDYHSKREKITYAIPSFLDRKLCMTPQEALKAGTRLPILLAPDNWALRHHETFKRLIKKLATQAEFKRFEALKDMIHKYSLVSPRVSHGLFSGSLPRNLRELNHVIKQMELGTITAKEGIVSLIRITRGMGEKHPLMICAEKLRSITSVSSPQNAHVFKI